jgi:hypothetical protein
MVPHPVRSPTICMHFIKKKPYACTRYLLSMHIYCNRWVHADAYPWHVCFGTVKLKWANSRNLQTVWFIKYICCTKLQILEPVSEKLLLVYIILWLASSYLTTDKSLGTTMNWHKSLRLALGLWTTRRPPPRPRRILAAARRVQRMYVHQVWAISLYIKSEHNSS